MRFASQENPHLASYNQEELQMRFDRVDRNADDFMFTLHHGDARKSVATNFMGIRTTFEELDGEVDQVARALFAFGIRQGDYVAISLPNLKESVLYAYGCWRIGAVANMIDPRTNGDGFVRRVQRTHSKLLVTVLNICTPKIDEILDKLPTVVVVSPSDSFKPFRNVKTTLGLLLYNAKKKKFAEGRIFPGSKYIWHTDFIKMVSDEIDIRATNNADMPAAVFYTSGTTADGQIKGCVVSHRALNAAPAAFKLTVRNEDYQRGFTFGGFVPFFSAYGAMCGMHAGLCGGLELLLIPVFEPEKFADLILKLKPNIFLGVPRFHEQFIHHPKLQKKNNRLRFIKIAISGGDKISSAAIEQVNEVFARSGYQGGLRVGYGATELGGSIACMKHYDPKTSDDWRLEGNVGYVLANCRAMVVDPDTMKELPYGQDGELLVHSMSQMLYYYGMPEATAEISWTAPNGTVFYRMGDKGHLDERGCFHFIDRYKRSIMRPDGHTVHPSPIENVIMMHEAVLACAVVGLRQKEASGAIPSAFVVLREGFETEESVRDVLQSIDVLCLKYLPERDRAIAYQATAELPYTDMGKIHFRALEKLPFEEEKFLITDFAFFPGIQKKQSAKTVTTK
ncbi:MAG: acyl--CoA ligase [Oscillospiraceae bacterium]|jgi:long-chain acyl-CoA synthetase|nr:acyl--CoA ligase [Oscillospiraceae bacterium]